MKRFTILPIILAAALAGPGWAAKPAAPAAPGVPGLAPVLDLAAEDMPYDAGEAVVVTWKEMPYDGPVAKYKVLASSIGAEGPWAEAASFASNTHYRSDMGLPFWAWRRHQGAHAVSVTPSEIFSAESAKDKAKLADAVIHVKVSAADGKSAFESGPVSARAESDWFSMPKLNNLIFTLVFCGIVLWFISTARKKDLFLRRIPGLDAVEDAIGRATEMGRPIYFLTGRLDIDSISTIAASLILGELAKRVAQYDTQLKVPHTYAMTMAVCQEITKQAYSEAGRPDAYRDDINFFITEDQFAYTAAVNGMMVREKPAACFYMGYYYAESLLLTEVGSSVGAIQIAGSDAEHQLPFFFITCDYTLIGEELYAAGAYLSRNPVLVGTLRGQDVGKAFIMVGIVLGVALATLGVLFGFEHKVQTFLEVFKSF